MPEKHPWEIYLLLMVIILQSILVIAGNPPMTAAMLLAVLAVAVGQSLLFSPLTAWAGGFFAVVAWVLLRQTMGGWMQAQSLGEIAGLVLCVALGVRFARGWRRQQRDLAKLRDLEKMLIADETDTGLLSREVGELRLMEEVERAVTFHRPLGLLIVEIVPMFDDLTTLPLYPTMVKAIARRLVSESLSPDIPFRIDNTHIGLIMPERDRARLYRDADALLESLQLARFASDKDFSHPVSDFLWLNSGISSYQEGLEDGAAMLRAAENALSTRRSERLPSRYEVGSVITELLDPSKTSTENKHVWLLR